MNLVAIVALMTEIRPARGLGRPSAISVRAVPGVIGDGDRLLRGSRVLAALVAVELFWGFSMVTFESLFPVRLSEIARRHRPGGRAHGPGQLAGLVRRGSRRRRVVLRQPADRRRAVRGGLRIVPGRDDRR